MYQFVVIRGIRGMCGMGVYGWITHSRFGVRTATMWPFVANRGDSRSGRE